MTKLENNLAWTIRRNKEGEVKVRYHSVPVDDLPEASAIKIAYNEFKAAIAALDKAKSRLEIATLAEARNWTVNLDDGTGDHPMIPEGYAGLVVTQYGLGVGAVPAAEKTQGTKVKAAKAKVNFGSSLGSTLIKAADAPARGKKHAA